MLAVWHTDESKGFVGAPMEKEKERDLRENRLEKKERKLSCLKK